MKAAFYTLYLAVIIVCLVMAILARPGLKRRRIAIFVPFLFYILVQEIAVKIPDLASIKGLNGFMYNIYRPLTLVIFAVIYYRLPFMKPFQKIILWTAAGYLALTVVNHTFFESIFGASRYLPLLRGFLITFYGIFFLFSYFQLDSKEAEEYWRPMMWITIGVVMFYPVTSIVVHLQRYLYLNSAMLGDFKLYNLVPQLMSYFMYSCFIFAFHLCRKEKLISS